jgi:hypothetical protein
MLCWQLRGILLLKLLWVTPTWWGCAMELDLYNLWYSAPYSNYSILQTTALKNRHCFCVYCNFSFCNTLSIWKILYNYAKHNFTLKRAITSQFWYKGLYLITISKHFFSSISCENLQTSGRSLRLWELGCNPFVGNNNVFIYLQKDSITSFSTIAYSISTDQYLMSIILCIMFQSFFRLLLELLATSVE